MAIENGTTVKVVLPENLMSRIAKDAQTAGIPVPSMLRIIVAGYYDLLLPVAQSEAEDSNAG